ncbi:carbon-nitrogen hydrolase family protein [Kitasatospora sp. NPDC101183]|uniref:carbon-nitrogen hydrolase family protein n=1 Tax=Kitasatospora sp. NPDC101183 TaxID=3364100 RepID=UPI003800AA64
MSITLENVPHPERPLRVATVQSPVVAGDVDSNAERAAELIREASAGGARLVLFAEKFLSGYEPELISSDPVKHAVQPGDPRLEPIARACREGGAAAVVGTAFRTEEGELRISALVFGVDGEIVTRYDKQYLFTSESAYYRPGHAGCSIELDGWRLGLGICYDSGFAEHARAAALDGCHAYLVGALFSPENGHHESRIWFPARAFDNGVYAVLANHVGSTGGWNTCGASAVWGPDGRLVAEAGADRREVLIADLDPEVLRAARLKETMVADLAAAGRPDAAGRGRHLLA